MNENKEKLLEIRDLSVTYITDDATLYAVNGLNLDLFRGETLGLVGETDAADDQCPAGCICTEQRNKFSVGETIEVMKPDGTNVPVAVEAMYNEEGGSVDSAPHPKQVLWIKLSVAPEHYDLLRVKESTK